jgi:hypothetical protein
MIIRVEGKKYMGNASLLPGRSLNMGPEKDMASTLNPNFTKENFRVLKFSIAK